MTDQQSGGGEYTHGVDRDGIPEDVSAIRWVWSQGWRGKLDVIYVASVVILLSTIAAIMNAVEHAVEQAKQ